MVKLVPVGIHGGDRDCNPAEFSRDALLGPLEGGVQPLLAHAVVGSSQIRQDQADVIHVCHGHEEVGQCRRGDHREVAVADRTGRRVFQVGRQLVHEDHQGIAPKQLLPGFWARGREDPRGVLGELVGLAKLLGDGAPDATRGVRVAAVEADHTAASQLRRRVIGPQNALTQFRIPGQEPQGDHAVGLTAAHRLGEQKHRRSGRTSRQQPEHPVHQGGHAVCEVVFLEELGPMDLVLQEGVEAEDRSATVGRENRFAGDTEGFEGHSEAFLPIFSLSRWPATASLTTWATDTPFESARSRIRS